MVCVEASIPDQHTKDGQIGPRVSVGSDFHRLLKMLVYNVKLQFVHLATGNRYSLYVAKFCITQHGMQPAMET